MGRQTGKYGFNKPDGTDGYDVETMIGQNMDLADEALHQIATLLNEWANDTGLHAEDLIRHITALERANWNSKAAGNHTHTAAEVGASESSHNHDTAYLNRTNTGVFTPTGVGIPHVWNGSSWVPGTAYVWDGSVWRVGT